MYKFTRNKIICLSLILVTIVIMVMQSSIFAATSDVSKLSEKVKDFTGGSLYKVNQNGKLKDIIVYDDGTTEDYVASKHSTLFPKDKITKELKKESDKLVSGSITIAIWLNDIDYTKVDKSAKDKYSIIDIDKSDKETVQKYIEEKRSLAKTEYTTKNKTFFTKYIPNDEIIFMSSYAPLIIVKTDIKNIAKLSKNDDVTFLDLFQDKTKSDEVTYSIPNINANYTRDTMGLKGSGVKVGIVEMGYPNKANAQLTGRSITFDVTDAQANSYLTEHATRVTSIIVGNTQGIVPNSSVYVTRAMNRTQDYSKIEWLLSQGVNVINYSAGYTDIRGTYSDMSKWIDHLSYQLNVSFVKSAGNNSGTNFGITDPGMAYNSNTVGSTFDNNSTNEPNWTDDSFSTFSCYVESSGCFKPDFNAPGQDIAVAGYSASSGTSFSAPHVTGVISQLFTLKADLKTKPAAINSILKTGTTHKTATDYGSYTLSPNYSNKEGAGVIDAKGAYNVSNGTKYMQSTLTNSQFPYQQYYTVTSTATPVRVTLTWLKQNTLTSGSIVERDLSDLDLYVYKPDGTLAASSTSGNNNTELVQFTPTVTGSYRIVVSDYLLMNSSEVVGLSWNQ